LVATHRRSYILGFGLFWIYLAPEASP